jgi:hypothetical protein
MHASHSPTRQVKWRVFLAGFSRGDPESAEFTRRCDPPFWAATFKGRGQGDLRFKFQDAYSKEEAFVSIVHINS